MRVAHDLDPLPTRRRASSASSGIESESPVTSSFASARRSGARSPSWTASNEVGGTGGTPPPAAPVLPNPPRGAPLLVLEERERVVGRLVERQPVGDPARGRADGAQDVALGTRLLVLPGVADRRPLEQHQQQHREQDDDDRVARGQLAAGRGVEGWLGHQNWK